MATLHILAHSPFTDSRFASCLSLLSAQHAVLLTGDAVYALQANTAPRALLDKLSEGQLFVLEEDVVARNLQSTITDQGQVVDYAGFVALCDRFPRVSTWL